MNWNKLQQTQLLLDNAILKEKPEMSAEERFNKTLVALSVEMAEVSNCSEHFKFWKDNKGKVDEKRFPPDWDYEGKQIIGYYDYRDKIMHQIGFDQAHKLTLIEECSDCLHFLLSIANQVGYEILERDSTDLEGSDLCEQYSEIMDWILVIKENGLTGNLVPGNLIWSCLSYFYSLGVTTQELEQAYYEKNKVNYERLREGY